MYCELRGERVYVGTGGKEFDPGRPCVVFLHGSGLDHTFWALHTRFFAFRGYSVAAPDLPGHSLSGGAPLASIEEMADWLDELVAELGASKLSLIGHSQGCLVALEYAARHPGDVRSLSLIASGLATPVNPALIEAAESAPDRAVAMMTSWGFGPAGQMYRGPVPGNVMMANGQRVMLANAPAALAADLKACNGYAHGAEAAAAIRCPAQVIIAGQDRMAPRRATDELIAALDQPEVERIAGSGHMVPVEAPDACRRALRGLIFRHNPAS